MELGDQGVLLYTDCFRRFSGQSGFRTGYGGRIFLLYLKRRLNVNTTDEILAVIEPMLADSERLADAVLKQEKSVVIYGMGKRGTRVLESFLKKREKEVFHGNFLQ